MEEEQENETDFTNLVLNLPLFSCIVREQLWLKKTVVSKSYIKKAIEDPRLFKEFSVLKSIRSEDSIVESNEENVSKSNHKSQRNPEYQLKLYEDLNWNVVPDYNWPVHPGDYSPLSPDGEFLDRHGKIGLDFWNWNRERSPLGYIPPLCTCKMTTDCVDHLRRWTRYMKLDFDKKVCNNDVCRGLLYIPFSLLEVPLNRIISNCSEFALKVKVPDSTDLYCGNMKHTLILCTTSKEHEKECLDAIEHSEISYPLVYDVKAEDFIPYFKKYNEETRESPLMSVEPIDSDVSDPEENYGMGQLFAIRKLRDNVLIEKYDQNLRVTSPVDEQLLSTWDKMVEESVKDQAKKEPGYKLLSKKINPESFCNLGSEELTRLRKELEAQDYIIYQMVESFSTNRRPLSFVLRESDQTNGYDLDDNQEPIDETNPYKKRKNN
uniref:Uncharacterized protein n=1 Tax=Theileria annulata TaxID=5874 RepID=A0A3B0MRV9_THEAN